MTKAKPRAGREYEAMAFPEGNAAKTGSLLPLIQELEAEDVAAGRQPVIASAAFQAAGLIRKMRLEAGMTQKTLAARIDVKQSRISELEAGTGSLGPSWDLMQRIASACGATLFLQPPHADFVVPIALTGDGGGAFAISPLAA